MIHDIPLSIHVDGAYCGECMFVEDKHCHLFNQDLETDDIVYEGAPLRCKSCKYIGQKSS